MKSLCLLAGALTFLPGVAIAQSYDDPTFNGLKVGASVDYRWLDGDYSLPRLDGRVDDDRGGVGFRGFIGYDVKLGNALVVGGEAGLGHGGESLKAQGLAGNYMLKPRWSWDASGRVGVLLAPTVLAYGRAGYSWLHVHETTSFLDASLGDRKGSGTEKGFLWGAGIETELARGVFARGEFDRANYGDGLTAPKIQFGLGVSF